MTLSIAELSQRSLEIFRELVDAYMETGEPIGSRTISKRILAPLSPATIRNIMADLEEAGLLYAPHTSAGRLPTPEGLRFFVHGLLEIGDITDSERLQLEEKCNMTGCSMSSLLEEATSLLSGLSKCAGVVMAPKTNSSLRHIEFVHLANNRVLVVLITQDGLVENRLVELPEDISVSTSTLSDATNYLNARLLGRTLSEAQTIINNELRHHKADLDVLTTRVVEAGLAIWAGGEEEKRSLIVKGQSNLLHNVNETHELDQIRELFNILDKKENLHKLVEASINADGIQIFIGAENNLFNLSGCSLVISPYHNAKQQIIGAIGVVGPSRMNYGKIISLVDYTAKLVSRLIT